MGAGGPDEKEGWAAWARGVLVDPSYRRVPFWAWACALLLCEAVLGVVLVRRVAYTNIDWDAYMEEVRYVAEGERDYAVIRGGTGPLVYPAGFVYLYLPLYYVTGGGRDVRLAQYVFLALYLASQLVVFLVYRRARATPPWVLVLLCLSRRLHSIFVLRLFNDGPAMLLAYAGVLAAQHNRWTAGTVLFSLATSVKMNALLFMPGLAVLMVMRFGLLPSVRHAAVFVAVQLALGAPFLAAYPASYFGRAFEFGRQFFYKWTVNFRFLPPHQFVSRELALGLLAAHLLALVVFAQARWARHHGGLARLLATGFAGRPGAARGSDRNLHPQTIATVLFVSNFIGIVCCRSLHFQFYSWYALTLPYLAWRTHMATPVRLLLLFSVELVWNVYPPQAMSSLALQLLHVGLLVGLAGGPLPPPPPPAKAGGSKEGKKDM